MDRTDDDIHTPTEFSISPHNWTTAVRPDLTIDPRLLETPNASILSHNSSPAQLSVGGVGSHGYFPSASASDIRVGSDAFSSSDTRSFADHQAEGSQNQMMRKRGACLKCKIQKKKVRRFPIILNYPN
jgi:hypothetical protein